MAETLDPDLIGVVVAAVCVGVLAIVIISLMTYCCFRKGLKHEKNSTLGRRDSRGSASTSFAPRWAPTMVPAVSAVPVYSVPAEPVIYPLPPHGYYLGAYKPRFVDADRLHHVHHGRETMDGDPTRSPSLRLESAAQPNGHVVHDFTSSSSNYRVIRKQHKHEKMPDWLRKSYGENEVSLAMSEEPDDSSMASPASQARAGITKEPHGVPDSPPETAAMARVRVSPSLGRQQQWQEVPRDFTILDFVDTEDRATAPTSPQHAARTRKYRLTSSGPAAGVADAEFVLAGAVVPTAASSGEHTQYLLTTGVPASTLEPAYLLPSGVPVVVPEPQHLLAAPQHRVSAAGRECLITESSQNTGPQPAADWDSHLSFVQVETTGPSLQRQRATGQGEIMLLLPSS